MVFSYTLTFSLSAATLAVSIVSPLDAGSDEDATATVIMLLF